MSIEALRSDESLQGLYGTDFYAWTQQQAALLGRGELAAVDLANVREEIETLGRKEVAELRSSLRILAAHLLKAMYQPEKLTRSWMTTILNQRIAIADHLDDNPSLKSKVAEAFDRSYDDARDLASSETGLPLEAFPTHPPFSFHEAVLRSWMPWNSEPADPGSSTIEKPAVDGRALKVALDGRGAYPRWVEPREA